MLPHIVYVSQFKKNKVKIEKKAKTLKNNWLINSILTKQVSALLKSLKSYNDWKAIALSYKGAMMSVAELQKEW